MDRFLMNTNRLAIKSRFLYGLNGGDEIKHLEERLQNCVVLENDRIESRLAAQELECGGVGTVAAAPGFLSQVGLLIPRNTGLVVTLEQCIATPAVPIALRRQYTSGVSIDVANPIARDSRAGSSRVPACRIVGVNGSAAAVGSQFFVVPGGQVYTGEFVAAGSETSDVIIWLDASTLNLAITGGFLWRERILEGGFLS